jgi:hypothetical protein
MFMLQLVIKAAISGVVGVIRRVSPPVPQATGEYRPDRRRFAIGGIPPYQA